MYLCTLWVIQTRVGQGWKYALAIWREFYGFDRLLEIEVVQHTPTSKVDQQGATVWRNKKALSMQRIM